MPKIRSENRRRTIILPVRCTAEEAAIIRNNAQASGESSVGSFLRQLALNAKAAPRNRAADREAIGRLLGEIGHLRTDIVGRFGNNLNQLTKYANMGRTLEASLQYLVNELIPVFERDLLEIRLVCMQALGKEPRRKHPALRDAKE